VIYVDLTARQFNALVKSVEEIKRNVVRTLWEDKRKDDESSATAFPVGMATYNEKQTALFMTCQHTILDDQKPQHFRVRFQNDDEDYPLKVLYRDKN
jgi:hypothetical protein